MTDSSPNPYYGGNNNNLARLTIPTMGQFDNPAVQIAMQTILQWANRLTAVTQIIAVSGITIAPTDGIGPVEVSSSGGGGLSIVGFGLYKPTNIVGWNSVGSSPFGGGTFSDIQWNGLVGFTNSFTYLQSGSEHFEMPANSLTIVGGSVSLEFSGNTISNVGLDFEGGPYEIPFSSYNVPDNTAKNLFITPWTWGLIDTFQSPNPPAGPYFFRLYSDLSSPGVSLSPSVGNTWMSGAALFLSFSISE